MIDVTKCFGCRKGIGLFIKEKKGFVHLDILATYEHGESIGCKNSDEIEKHLKKNKGKGTYLPDQELEAFYEKQADWWYDIEEMFPQIFDDVDDLNAFFNQGEKGDKIWNKSNEVIGAELLKIAKDKGVTLIKGE